MTVALDLNNPPSACEIKKVARLQFRIFDPEFLRQMSAKEVTETDLYENGVPKSGGLNDPMMGTTDYRMPCGSCNMDLKNCPGHFGHINLATPVYHIGFLTTLVRVLRCVCYSCSRLLCDPEDSKFQAALRIRAPKARLARIHEMAKTKRRCEGETSASLTQGKEKDLTMDLSENKPTAPQSSCGCLQPSYVKDGINISIQFPTSNEENPEEEATEDSKRILTAADGLSILKKMSPDHIRILGFDPDKSRPAWMILTVLPVPPPAVRPYVQFGGDRAEDDLTLKLLDVVKTNVSYVKSQKNGAPDHSLRDIGDVLQYHIVTYMNNEIPGIPVATTRSKKPIKSLRQRLKGKEGRLRGNLMGKRVDFSARTVITGDPNLMIDEVGVPKSVAMNLTFPETVTPLNIEHIRKLVNNGPFEWPGARYVIQEDGTRFDLRHCQGNSSVLQLDVGFRVERHMCDGDYVLFNRQPSLHKMSIMGHKIRVLPWSTFRLNLSVTSPYNADFDGDEMNLHLAQSHETRAEIKHLMMVNKQIVAPQGNKPCMGIVQDSLLGIHKFTRRDTFLDKRMLMTLLMWIPYWGGLIPPPCIFRPQPLWSGKQVITSLLKFDSQEGETQCRINLIREGDQKLKNDYEWNSENDNRVIIRDSCHLAGIICRRTAGSSSGSLIHTLFHEGGPEKTKLFLSVTQAVINNWLQTRGFTVGCIDIFPHPSTVDKIKNALIEASDKVHDLISQTRKGELETQPGKSLFESFESRVNQLLNQARENAGKVAAEALDETNNIIAMVRSGSKGTMINISQIMACVGQQNVEGKRIPFGFRDRSLPMFLKHDYGPESRGFVFNSYLSGLKPHELFFHAMGGREGIIDTACKTSETGYIQRRLIKAMEDVQVQTDRTVRNSNGDIVQFLYGEDGIAGEYVEDQPINLMKMDIKQMKKVYFHDVQDPKYGVGWLSEETREQIKLSYEDHKVLESEWNSLVNSRTAICNSIFPEGEWRQHLPVNINRLIELGKIKFPQRQEHTNVSPVTLIKKVEQMLLSLDPIVPKIEMSPVLVFENSIHEEAVNNAAFLIRSHLRSSLASKKLLEEDKLGSFAIDWLLGEVRQRYRKALANPGEVVGALAAQSIGEPATQMTLNTFHFAGVGSKNVTLGVPRLKELINVAKTVKTPSLTVYLEDHASRDQDIAKDIQSHLEHTNLAKVTAYSQIIYDPEPMKTILKADRQWVAEYYEFPDDEDTTQRLGPYVLRICLLESMLTGKQLTMKEIGERICAEFSSDELDCIWTDDNSEELILRIRLKHNADNNRREDDDGAESEDEFLQRLMSVCLTNVTLRGISGIEKVFMREERRQVYNNTTEKFESKVTWVLDTDGCNLESVLPVENVDETRTTSNDIIEVYQVLGIEGVRRALLREMRAVISFDGSYVNYRHLSVLCDMMTQKGNLTSITRNGINRIDRGPLVKCSFEETLEIITSAAVFAEVDHLRGITENVMFGQHGPFGTSLCEILIDEEKLKSIHPSTGVVGGISGAFDDNMLSPDSSMQDISSAMSPQQISNFTMNPTSPFSPRLYSPDLALQAAFSPTAVAFSPTSPSSPLQDIFSPQSPQSSPSAYTPLSPGLQLSSPMQSYSPSSPLGNYSPSSPLSPKLNYSPTSPGVMSPNAYSPTSPTAMSPNAYSPTSPTAYSPTSPSLLSPNAYSPTSPSAMSPNAYSPTSPSLMSPNAYSPTSPSALSPNAYSPTSPSGGAYSISSPRNVYSPTSPSAYSPTSPAAYSPTSPTQD
eukprot:GHVP01050621.1.p1 GENE.GHVP01050621.1~~GHVP01050621.1.p1  ORF type:complete len:1762 (+),score=250.74 GHVP01050621.1:27-5312(+)